MHKKGQKEAKCTFEAGMYWNKQNLYPCVTLTGSDNTINTHVEATLVR